LQNKIGDYIPPLEGVTLQIAAPRGWVWSRVGSQYLVGFHEKGSSLNKLPRILVSVEDSPFPGIKNVDESSVRDLVDQVSRQHPWKDAKETIVPVKVGDRFYVRVEFSTMKGSGAVARQTLMTVIGGRLYTIHLDADATHLSRHQEAAYAVAASVKLAKTDRHVVDTFAVCVYKDNPIESITSEQLALIYSKGSPIKEWSQLDVGYSGKITPISFQSGSNMHRRFRQVEAPGII